MSTESVMGLIGDDERYVSVPAVDVVAQVQLGDGLAGPLNDQPLEIYRDTRPLAVDELGMGHLGKVARHRAGRTFPLNYGFGAGLDYTMPGRPPQQDTLHPSVFGPGQDPAWHTGVPGPEVVRNPRTVLYTTTPQVGWEGW